MDFIKKSYEDNPDWHLQACSIVLQTGDLVTKALTAMHDINKSTRNSHMKTNFVHTLHCMQKVGTLPLSEFSRILTHEEMLVALAQAELPADNKKSWYPIPRARFLEYIHNQDLAEANDNGQRRDKDETSKGNRMAAGFKAAIDNSMEAKRAKLNTAFTKYLSISNPANGKHFLSEIGKHWTCNVTPEMTTKKL